jgi:hypothetical protein
MLSSLLSLCRAAPELYALPCVHAAFTHRSASATRMLGLQLVTVTVPQTELQTLFTLASGAVQINHLSDGIQLAKQQQTNAPSSNASVPSSAASTSSTNTISNSTSALSQVPPPPASYTVTQPVASMFLSLAAASSFVDLSRWVDTLVVQITTTWRGMSLNAVRWSFIRDAPAVQAVPRYCKQHGLIVFTEHLISTMLAACHLMTLEVLAPCVACLYLQPTQCDARLLTAILWHLMTLCRWRSYPTLRTTGAQQETLSLSPSPPTH